MRKAITLLVLLLLVFSLSLSSLAAVDLSDPQYVVDDAGVLSPELEQRILETNEMLWNDCSGAEFVVVTVNYPPAGLDNEEYAKKIFDTWHIGSASEDNGMLLVLYTEADDFWLQPGEGIYSSAYVDEIADMVSDNSSFYRAILEDRDEEAVSVLLEGVTRWYQAHWQAVSYVPFYSGGGVSSQSGGEISDLQAFMFLVFLILLFYIITSPIRCRRRWGRWGIWPLYYFSPWWHTRSRVIRPMSYRSQPVNPPRTSSYTRPSNYTRPPSGHSSSASSFHSGGGRSGSSGFGGGRTSGGFSGRPGGGGRSGSGGFGHR